MSTVNTETETETVVTQKAAKTSCTPGAMPSAAAPIKAPLRSRWRCWFHRLDDPNWLVTGYRMVYCFDSVQDFWRMQNSMPPVFSGMFFVMKDGVLPLYEDSRNAAGGVWSFKVPRRKLQDAWNQLLLHLVGETLYPDADAVTGVSVNPKNCVVKVWLSRPPRDSKVCEIVRGVPSMLPDKALFTEPSKNPARLS